MKKLERGAPLEGRTFTHLIVLQPDTTTIRNCRNQHYWCRCCRCGRVVSVSRSNLLSQHSRSCGCVRRKYAIPAYLETNHA
jgi:hypothetical protein